VRREGPRREILSAVGAGPGEPLKLIKGDLLDALVLRCRDSFQPAHKIIRHFNRQVCHRPPY
jgi:hypothetical protein